MALWKCASCDFAKDSRCKPKKCPECEGIVFEKDETETKPKTGCCCNHK